MLCWFIFVVTLCTIVPSAKPNANNQVIVLQPPGLFLKSCVGVVRTEASLWYLFSVFLSTTHVMRKGDIRESVIEPKIIVRRESSIFEAEVVQMLN